MDYWKLFGIHFQCVDLLCNRICLSKYSTIKYYILTLMYKIRNKHFALDEITFIIIHYNIDKLFRETIKNISLFLHYLSWTCCFRMLWKITLLIFIHLEFIINMSETNLDFPVLHIFILFNESSYWFIKINNALCLYVSVVKLC